MALTVEDGTGIEAADALVSFAFVTTYASSRGLLWTAVTADGEAAIRRATTNLSTAWSWKGYETHGRGQGQAFPRTDCTDAEGEDIASDEIPVEVQHACAELAVRELAQPGSSAPDVILTERVKSETVGPIRTDYVVGNLDAEAARPAYLLVKDIVGGLLAGTSSSIFGTSVRS